MNIDDNKAGDDADTVMERGESDGDQDKVEELRRSK